MMKNINTLVNISLPYVNEILGKAMLKAIVCDWNCDNVEIPCHVMCQLHNVLHKVNHWFSV